MRVRWGKITVVLASLAAVALPAGCPGPAEDPGTDVTGDISQATELDGTYNITTDVSVSAALTIMAGSTLRFAKDASLTVGMLGSITAEGTESAPITFTSDEDSQAVGDWDGVTVASRTAAFTWCVFEYADAGLSLVDAAVAAVTSCTFRYNTKGLDASIAGLHTTISSNTFSSNGEPLLINVMYSLDDSNTFTDNTNQRITVGSGTTAQTRSWGETEVPFSVAGAVTISGGTFTIAAGTTLEFGSGASLEVTSVYSGNLEAIGTSDAPITFTSAEDTPAAGDWDGVTLEGASGTFSWCILQYAATALELDSDDVSITDCTIQYNTIGIDASASSWTDPGSNTYSSNGTNVKL